MTRLGVVAEATVDVLAARLTIELPGLPDHEVRAIARQQAEDLRAAGWRITAPASALPAGRRRRKKGALQEQRRAELSLGCRLQHTLISNLTLLGVFTVGCWAIGQWLIPALACPDAGLPVWLEVT